MASAWAAKGARGVRSPGDEALCVRLQLFRRIQPGLRRFALTLRQIANPDSKRPPLPAPAVDSEMLPSVRTFRSSILRNFCREFGC